MSTVYLVTCADGVPRGYSPHRDTAERYHARALFEGDSDGGRIDQALR